MKVLIRSIRSTHKLWLVLFLGVDPPTLQSCVCGVDKRPFYVLGYMMLIYTHTWVYLGGRKKQCTNYALVNKKLILVSVSSPWQHEY